MSRLGVRAGSKPIQWSHASSKFSNLQMLSDHSLSVPPTLEITESDLDQVGDRVSALSTSRSDHWMVRFDGDPSVRFAVDGGSAPVDELPELIRHAWSSRPSRDLRILVQQKLARSIDGIAVRTTSDVVVIESQFDSPGNFYRDGSVPSRWMFDASKAESAATDGLPRVVAVELSKALLLMPPTTCVEWVLTIDEAVYFVDAKPLPTGFLAGLTPDDLQNECTPLMIGSAAGLIKDPDTMGEGPTIHLVRSTHVDMLKEIGSLSQGVVFGSGGLLSHAVVYCAQLAVPLVMCPNMHVESRSRQMKYELTVGRDSHALAQC